MKGTQEKVVVTGGQGQGNGMAQMTYPHGVVVDQLGTIYVADAKNHRVIRRMKEMREEGVCQSHRWFDHHQHTHSMERRVVLIRCLLHFLLRR